MTWEPESWNALVGSLPGAHILQTWQWGQVKSISGWEMLPQAWGDLASALVLKRRLYFGKLAVPSCVLYVPKGPLLDWTNETQRKEVLDDLQRIARQQGAIFIKIDPDILIGTGVPGTPDYISEDSGQVVIRDFQQRGWLLSSEQVQFRNTVLIDLTGREDQILSRMKQKTRYNIRLAEKKGVKVRFGNPSDFPLLYRMYSETSLRDGFVIRNEGYYERVWSTFMESGMAQPLVAEVDQVAVAAIFVFKFAGRAWYIYGMSRDLHREKMPNYLLQWEGMRWAKSTGCHTYDLWGAPDNFTETDRMWGVYRFKEGLGGRVVCTIGAWDYPVNPSLYKLYTQILPRILAIMRRRGRENTRREVLSA